MTRFALFAAACACGIAAPAWAQDLPARQPGLWEMSTQMAGMPGGVGSQQCVDAGTDADMQRRAFSRDGKEQCTQKSFRRTADGYEMRAECTGPEGRATVDAKVSGDFASSYRMVNHVAFDPPRHGVAQADMTITARHAGACPAGMKPGEVRVAGMGAGGRAAAPGGAPTGLPPGVDPKALQSMSPEQLKALAEQMKAARGGN